MTANRYTICNNNRINGAPTKAYLCYIFNLIHGFGIVVDTCLATFNYNWVFAKQKMGYKYENDYKLESMNFFNIEAYGNDFSVKKVCASGKIDVFGVRV